MFPFLREFAESGVSNELRERASYALTLLCLRIVELASGQLGTGAEALPRELPATLRDVEREAESCSRWLLPLVLQQSHDPSDRELIGRTVSHLVQFFEKREEA